MKILFIINSLMGGGAEKLINDLLPILNKQYDCELLILSNNKQKYLDTLKKKLVKVTVVPSSKKSHIEIVRFIKEFIELGNFDIVHANLFPVIYYCALLKICMGKRFPVLVMTEHSTNNSRRKYKIFRPLEKKIYKAYDHVISISKKTQECLLEWLKLSEVDSNCFSVIDNGIAVSEFFSAVPYTRNELFFDIDENDIILCMVASFKEAKNHEFMLNVMKKMPDNYKLLLIGEGELKEKIQEQSAKMELDEKIIFCGFRKDVAKILKAVDIVVIPSKWEGFGLVAVEAMACGKPVIASDVPGLAEVIDEAGIKVELNNEEKFVESIIGLQDKEEYKKFSELAIKRAELFDINIMSDRYANIYNTCIKN